MFYAASDRFVRYPLKRTVFILARQDNGQNQKQIDFFHGAVF
jgi:hypothetical protein